MCNKTTLFGEVEEAREYNRYLMLNKDHVICEFNLVSIGTGIFLEEVVNIISIDDLTILDKAIFGIFADRQNTMRKDLECRNKLLLEFIRDRRAPSNRAFIDGLFNQIGNSIESYLEITLGLSLTDTFWFKRCDSGVTWGEVSLYRNKFNEVISNYAFTGTGLHGMRVETPSPEFSTDGALPKCWIKTDAVYLIKGGTEGYANAGREPYMEYLASKVAEVMELNAIKYEVAKYKGRAVSKCKLFTSESRSYFSFAKVMGREAGVYPIWNTKEIFELYKKLGFLKQLCEMIVFDGIVCNSDRHLGNFGFLVDSDTLDVIEPAPIFDNGMSFGKNYISRVDGGIDGYFRKALQPGPAVLGNGIGFTQAAKEVLCYIDRRKVRRLLDFSFDAHLPELVEPDVEMISKLVRHQAKEILR